MAAFLAWLCFTALLIVYVVYPGVMAFVGRRSGPAPPVSGLPTVTIVIAARNEAAVIARKIRSCLAQDYPKERLDVLLVSDGSEDETVGRAAVAAAGNGRLRVVELSGRTGKAGALNAAIDHVESEIAVLTDARQPLDAGAVRHLVARFEDPEVGCVSGDLRYRRDGERGMQGALHRYWEYERRIRMGEARIHSCVGATGALYAIRRSLWVELPDGLLLDDVFTPMQIVLSGHRALFEPRAWAADIASAADDREYRRRVRTLTGNYQLLYELPALLHPGKNPIWPQYVLHKLGRLLTPALLLGLLLGTGFATGLLYDVAFGLQSAFWAAALFVGSTRSHVRFSRPLALPYAFAVTQGAAVQAFVHSLRRNWSVWEDRG